MSAGHPDQIAAIGYGFGGDVVLQMAPGGHNSVAVASFHGTHDTKFDLPLAYNAEADRESWDAMRRFLAATIK